MKRLLAQSEKFKILSEFETVELVISYPNILKQNRAVYMGDFYGDPTCALISRDEKYLVVGGNGLLIYTLSEPFPSALKTDNKHFKELFRDPKNTWWIDTVYQSTLDQDWKYFRAVVHTEEGLSVYRIDAETGEHIKQQCS